MPPGVNHVISGEAGAALQHESREISAVDTYFGDLPHAAGLDKFNPEFHSGFRAGNTLPENLFRRIKLSSCVRHRLAGVCLQLITRGFRS
jgi:hypothetical protein